MNIVLIVGSAPDAVRVRHLDLSAMTSLVVINNAWQLRADWDYLIHPEDFPVEKRPIGQELVQSIVTAAQYVAIQNQYGGFVYAGGTMAFTAAYWALGALRPDVMLFLGCDMVYENTGAATHFYGNGSPDPLREDVTLQSLEAKASRLNYFAAQQDCLCLNLSDKPSSRLVFPRIAEESLAQLSPASLKARLAQMRDDSLDVKAQDCLTMEREMHCYIESGRYWEHLNAIDASRLKRIDDSWNVWMKSVQAKIA